MYELLGNDPELDPNRPAEPPTKAIDKPAPRHGKRDGSDVKAAPPAERQGNQSRAKQSGNANDNAFRDRDAGASSNRQRGSGEPEQRGGRGGRGRGGRGGARGGRGGPRADDRHSKTGLGEHEKQAAHGWGAETGEAELADEQAGEAIAKKEEKEAVKEDAEAEAEAEVEDNSKSYTAYLAELAEKKLKLGEQNLRKANEGSSKQFPEGTQVERKEEDFFAASAGKAKRERQRKEKVHVELDGDRMLAPPPREGGSRGRGDRGGRGRGEGRGSFRGGEGRGRGGDRGARGEGRGGRGRGEARGAAAGAPRGGRGAANVNVNDSSAFPSLGA